MAYGEGEPEGRGEVREGGGEVRGAGAGVGIISSHFMLA